MTTVKAIYSTFKHKRPKFGFIIVIKGKVIKVVITYAKHSVYRFVKTTNGVGS